MRQLRYIEVVKLPGGQTCGHRHRTQRAAAHCRRLWTRTGRPGSASPGSDKGAEVVSYLLRIL